MKMSFFLSYLALTSYALSITKRTSVDEVTSDKTLSHVNNKIGHQSSNKEPFAYFINSLNGSTNGVEILSLCTQEPSLDSKDQDAFIKQFNKVQTSTAQVISKKTFKEITGQVCTYDLSDPNVFLSAKTARADIGTKALFLDLFETAFINVANEFTNCIKKDPLKKIITDEEYLEELRFFLEKDKHVGELFDSFCSVNNIFSYTLKPFEESKDGNKQLAFIGEIMRG